MIKVFYQIIQYDNQSERYLQLFNSHEKYFIMNLFIKNVKFIKKIVYLVQKFHHTKVFTHCWSNDNEISYWIFHIQICQFTTSIRNISKNKWYISIWLCFFLLFHWYLRQQHLWLEWLSWLASWWQSIKNYISYLLLLTIS